ncbi:unnamed protein product [Symbiodinium sp. CCMP2456]|nr:unnamed protein product [Symbiodinium sp. CCMP2456]
MPRDWFVLRRCVRVDTEASDDKPKCKPGRWDEFKDCSKCSSRACLEQLLVTCRNEPGVLLTCAVSFPVAHRWYSSVFIRPGNSSLTNDTPMRMVCCHGFSHWDNLRHVRETSAELFCAEIDLAAAEAARLEALEAEQEKEEAELIKPVSPTSKQLAEEVTASVETTEAQVQRLFDQVAGLDAAAVRAADMAEQLRSQDALRRHLELFAAELAQAEARCASASDTLRAAAKAASDMKESSKACTEQIQRGIQSMEVECPLCRTRCPIAEVSTNFALCSVAASLATSQQPVQQQMETPTPLPWTEPYTEPLLPPAQEDLSPSAPPLQPWEVGPQNMYDEATYHAEHFHVPEGMAQPESMEAWIRQRREILRDWGQKREQKMHRKPWFIMDQMISGSGLYPPRLLDTSWFTPKELTMISRLEHLLQDTGHAHTLAYDMLTPLIYDIEAKTVLRFASSMTDPFTAADGYQGAGEHDTPELAIKLSIGAPHPFEAFRSYISVELVAVDEVEEIFQSPARGTTPMDRTLTQVLQDFAPASTGQPLLILALTDGEANDMNAFNQVLDRIQNMVYGDVQVCLMGLSLVKEDIEWFEQEECEDTRIRTIEAFEVENRQIQMKEVMKREGGYTFAMHVMRALVTNFYPADYDYETPLQNFRHRLYITIHGRDRWWGQQNPLWFLLCTSGICPACFLATGCHCCGWLQGNDCGKYEIPQCLEPYLKDE